MLLLVFAQSNFCYEPLQSNPGDFIHTVTPDSPMLSFAPSNMVYLYTSLWEDSDCSRNNIVALNFCYRASRTANGSTDPIFSILLLFDKGSNYTVSYIYHEREDREFCLAIAEETNCCKDVAIQSSSAIVANSSYALAFVIPEATRGSHLFEVGGVDTSMGYILDSSPVVPEVGTVFQLARETPRPIPNLLFRVSIEKVYVLCVYTVEPPIKDPLRRGQPPLEGQFVTSQNYHFSFLDLRNEDNLSIADKMAGLKQRFHCLVLVL